VRGEERGMRAAQSAILVNTALAVIKLVAGFVGNTYALVADAVESLTDVFGSTIVWGGLRVSARDADDLYPFGYGKAEPLATAVVSLLIVSAAIGIAVQAVRHILTPHVAPAAWTLIVLVVVVAVKWLLARRVDAVATEIGSGAVKADAWHHMSDAITSVAAFVGISIAILAGPGWESADDWAALAASFLIAYNGARMMKSASHELMDRAPDAALVAEVRRVAAAVPGVLAIEKLGMRKSGLTYRVTIHVQADPHMSLDAAHALGGQVKRAIISQVPRISSVLVHMEPYESHIK
jgi:cation diffusion facilitator family transporter